MHLHVYAPDDQVVADYLDLRDWLRESHSDRVLFEATKTELAQRQWSDMNHYADAKSDSSAPSSAGRGLGVVANGSTDARCSN